MAAGWLAVVGLAGVEGGGGGRDIKYSLGWA